MTITAPSGIAIKIPTIAPFNKLFMSRQSASMSFATDELLALETAERGEMPTFVEDDTIVPMDMVGHLIGLGYLSGRPVPCNGVLSAYECVAITASGHQRLETIRAASRLRVRIWMAAKWTVGGIVAIGIALAGIHRAIPALFDWFTQIVDWLR